jgi:hypothetical protein
LSFSLDTSSLIWAWRFAYPRANFPTLWQRLEGLIRDGRIRASSMVLAELERIEDELLEWARAQDGLFVELDRPQQESVRDVLAEFPGLAPAGEDRINADPFVIALAIRDGSTVFSQERLSGNPATPKIPNVCAARGVECVNFLQFIARQGWVF